ncbi:transporter substrate-binding domain-containing diguanylate cyclase [Amedibacillus sp. YH-ame6]
MIIIMLVFSLNVFSIQANDKEVIRVGFPSLKGLSMKDSNGNYYGYDYDYLMQIAQYTGWKYEFVEVEGDANQRITTLMEMLKKGEIDLLGDTKYIESLSNDYDYTSEPYGSAYNVIAVKDDSNLLDLNGILNKKNLKIGIMKNSSKRESYLNQYADSNGFSYEKVLCENEEDLVTKLDKNEIDAFLYVDLSLPDNCHSIARFSPDPFYFITTKGNSALMNDLNKALTTIDQVNPAFPSSLYNRYFVDTSTTLVLNSEEQSFIKNHKEIAVLVRDGGAPIQYYDGKTKGIAKDILDTLSETYDVSFRYVYAKDYDEYQKLALSGDIDIILSLPYNLETADEINIMLSDPYLSSNLLLVNHTDVDPTKLDSLKQASVKYSTELFESNSLAMSYESTEELMEALNRHEVDYAYINSYMFTYYMNKHGYKHISSLNAPEHLKSQYVFGVSKSENLTLLTILNKTIRAQSANIDSYIYKNAYMNTTFDLSEFILDHIVAISFIFISLVGMILYIIRSYYKKQLKMKKAVEIEYKRYQLLSDISKEMTFSYDYIHDYLKVSNTGIGKISDNEFIYHFARDTKHGLIQSDILSIIHTYIMKKEDIICEVETCLQQGHKNWYQLSLKVIRDKEKDKESTIYAVGKIVDIQKEKQEKEALRIKSETDILTGILNRGAVQKKISSVLLQQRSIGALIMVDLDNFKRVNDEYGHLDGDEVLIETATLLSTLYKDHIVARLGGDEFIIYIEDTSGVDLEILFKETLDKFENLTSMKNKSFNISISIGCVYTTYSRDYLELLKHADENLYEVKRNGRNNYVIT